jgi:hypothetical protein
MLAGLSASAGNGLPARRPAPVPTAVLCRGLYSPPGSCLPLPPVQSALLADRSTPGLKLADALEALATADYSLTVGADETIQLLNVVGQVHKAYVGTA